MEDELSRAVSAHYGLLTQQENACTLVLPCSLKGIRPTQVHDVHALPTQQPLPAQILAAKQGSRVCVLASAATPPIQ